VACAPFFADTQKRMVPFSATAVGAVRWPRRHKLPAETVVPVGTVDTGTKPSI
jgi:hypothetical protein